MDCVKMNVDASLDLDRLLVGVGVVICNHSGLVLGSSWQSVSAVFSPAIAEVMAPHRGLIFASELGVMLNFVESDSSTVVDLVNCCESSCADIGLV
ncbi:hypothetical protein ACOSQ3_002810 [Xanthoceras sorbifolium]